VRTTIVGIENDEEKADATPVSVFSTGIVDFATGDSTVMMASEGGGPPGSIETRTVSGVSYLRVNGEGMWMPSPTAEIAPDVPPLYSVLTGAGGLGSGSTPVPTQWLGVLAQVSDVEPVGDETIDGVETIRYHATFDLLAALADAMGEDAPDAPSGDTEVDVWIDGDGRVRRLVVEVPARHGPVVMRTDITDFGIPVDVAAPPPSQVLHVAPLPEGI
jgi:hypothetical protein